jgi:nucleoporin SEH1
MLAVGCSGSPSVFAKVWAYDSDHRKWRIAANLGGKREDVKVADDVLPDGVEYEELSNVHDISWAPDVGRSFHLIAVASKEALTIWRLDPSDTGELQPTLVALMKDHQKEVWRAEWNVTGTVLASSGDDGIVRMWRCDPAGRWVCVSEIQGTYD